MRTFLIISCLVAGCLARPRDFDIDAFNTAMEESIPGLLDSVADKSSADAIRPFSDAIIDLVREHIPEEGQEQFRKNVERNNAQLDKVVALVRQMPSMDFWSSLGGDANVDVPDVVIPELKISL